MAVIERPVPTPVYVDRPVIIERPVPVEKPVIIEKEVPVPVDPHHMPPALPVPHSSRQARVTIQVAEGARLTVNEQPIAMNGPSQTFVTPVLESSRAYHYDIKATMTRNGQEYLASRRVAFRAGETVTVDLREVRSWTAVRPSAQPEAARVHVKLPVEAALYVDGVRIPIDNGERILDTPPLQQGRPYHYTMKVELRSEGRTITQTKRVVVEAGKLVTVEFEELAVQSASTR